MTVGWEERLLVEHAQLKVRVDQLSRFMDTPDYDSLSPANQAWLLIQCHGMALYDTALQGRIDDADAT